MTKGLHKNSLRKVDNPHQWMIDDARMELIQQIKAKIEQLKKDVDNTPLATEQIAGYLFALVDVQKLLSTLQEQPVCEDVEMEIKETELEYQQRSERGEYPASIESICRRFYELGKQSKPTTAEGLDEEITEFIANHYEVDYYDGLQHHGEYLDTYDVEDIARHFAQWGAEHLKK